MTVGDAIRNGVTRLGAVGIDTPRLDAQLLLSHVLDCRREDLAREPERPLTSMEQSAFEDALARRERREPLPYITGVQEFYGRPFQVTPAVLIPRPETELLVELTLAKLKDINHPRIVDVGTGSGCIAVSLAAEIPHAEVWATDISPYALAVARSNAERLGVDDRVHLVQGDLLEPLATSTFHAIVSNPPYVAESELSGLQAEVRDYEPRWALSGKNGASGESGTDLYPRIFAQAMPLLLPDGWVAVEIGAGQVNAVTLAAVAAGFVDVDTAKDLAGITRVVLGRKRA